MTAFESIQYRAKYCVRNRCGTTPFFLPTKALSSWLTYEKILRVRSTKWEGTSSSGCRR